jgi:hypothetical protein
LKIEDETEAVVAAIELRTELGEYNFPITIQVKHSLLFDRWQG